MKYTTGPWHVRESQLYKEGTREINPNLPRRVCAHCGKPAVYSDGTPAFDPAHINIEAKGWGVAQIGTLDPVGEFEQHMANARLIAAAPDLLAAVQAASKYVDGFIRAQATRGGQPKDTEELAVKVQLQIHDAVRKALEGR